MVNLPGIARTDRGLLAEWWWTVDRFLLLGFLAFIALGIMMAFAASPAVAHRLELPTYYFAYRQMLFLCLAFFIALGLSLCSPDILRRIGFICGGLAMLGLVLALWQGDAIKGAQRWIRIFGFSVQPSEFLKPCFVIAIAWCFALQNTRLNMRGTQLALAIYLASVLLLILQPDFGQTAMLTMIWFGMYIMAGGSYMLAALLAFIGLGGLLFAYHHLPHVQTRVQIFLNPASGDTYQIDRAIEAVRHGGFFGAGLGDGKIKSILPDAHTDYVFAVAAEEGGIVLGLTIIALFAAFILRGLWRVRFERVHWIQLSATGLIALLGLQSFINLGVNLNMLPAKGMTLPFISYGGSSLLALALTMGMILAFTRKRWPLGKQPAAHVQEVDWRSQGGYEARQEVRG